MHPQRSRAGFTLIEIMAVVVLLGIMAGIAIPALQTKTSYALHNQADALVATLELARTRAAVTGRTHRVHLSLQRIEAENRNQDIADRYLIEWIAPLSNTAGATPASDATAPASGAETSLQLVPPSHAAIEAEYQPIPGQFGRSAELDRDVYIEAIEAPEGVYQQGSIYVYFYADASADPLKIILGNDAGHRLTLEVQALADAIRITEGI